MMFFGFKLPSYINRRLEASELDGKEGLKTLGLWHLGKISQVFSLHISKKNSKTRSYKSKVKQIISVKSHVKRKNGNKAAEGKKKIHKKRTNWIQGIRVGGKT